MPSVGLAAAASWERMREREEHVMATTGRMKRRLIGMLQKRIGEARLDEVPDSRDRRGRRWELGTLLAGPARPPTPTAPFVAIAQASRRPAL